MENIILSLQVFSVLLQIAFLISLIAIAQTLRRTIGIWSPFWIVIFFSLKYLGEYANPFLMKQLTEEWMPLGVPSVSVTLGQLVVFLSSAHLIFLLLGAFGLLALVLADLSHTRWDAGDAPSALWFQRFESVGRHRLGIGLATVLLTVAHPALLVLLLSID